MDKLDFCKFFKYIVHIILKYTPKLRRNAKRAPYKQLIAPYEYNEFY